MEIFKELIKIEKNYNLKNKKNLVLTDEQVDIVKALLNNDVFFNCAQTGIGKTFSTITAAIHKHVERKDEDINFVLVIPNAADKAFTDCLGKQFGIPYNIYTASKTRTMPNAKFHIFNYSTLTANLVDKKNNKVKARNGYIEKLFELKKNNKNLWLIVDEAHALQDPNTQQYIVMKTIMPLFIGKWALTATPILNDLEGLFWMVELFKPGFFKNIFAFRNKFMIFENKTFWKKDRFGVPKPHTKPERIGYKNLDKLQLTFNEISIIRSKQYNLDFIYREAELSEQMVKYYKYAAEGLFSGTKVDKGKKTKRTKKSKQEMAGARLHDLQRVVSNSHPDFKYLKDENKLTEKEYLLVKTVKEVIDREEACLIYFSYLETLDRVKYIFEKLQSKFNIPRIHQVSGKISKQKRKLVEETIGPRDIVLITSAGTESINLQRANNLIFYEIPFPLREFIQACGRIARTNTKFDSLRIYILEAVGTIDTYKKMRIVANSEPIKAVLGSSNILPTELLVLSDLDKQAMKDEYLWWK